MLNDPHPCPGRLFTSYMSPLEFIVDAKACMTLGNAYFGIPLPRAPGNPLQDMMASFFGGGPAASAGPGTGRGGPKKLRAAGNLD